MGPTAPTSLSEPAGGRAASARRLAFAAAASTGVHAWLAGTLALESLRPAARAPVGAPIEARLQAPLRVPAAAEPAADDPPAAPATGGEAPGKPAAASRRSSPVAAPAQALPAPADPTYYTARDLDVYPRPVVPLEFGRLGATGRYRITLLIDETGRVTAVEGEGRHEALAAALAATRFHPARRDGREVKSRVLLELDAAGAGR